MLRRASLRQRDAVRDVRAKSTVAPRLIVDLADALLKLFGLVSHWSLRARGFGFLLALPVLVVATVDWRVRRAA